MQGQKRTCLGRLESIVALGNGKQSLKQKLASCKRSCTILNAFCGHLNSPGAITGQTPLERKLESSGMGGA